MKTQRKQQKKEGKPPEVPEDDPKNVSEQIRKSGPKSIKLFSFSTQLSMKFKLHIINKKIFRMNQIFRLKSYLVIYPTH